LASNRLGRCVVLRVGVGAVPELGIQRARAA
jgi:hypothetical protein